MADRKYELVQTVASQISAKGPNGNGWYSSRCPFAGHKDKNASFGFTLTGYNCKGCGRKGSLSELAAELGIEVPAIRRGPFLSADDAATKLRQRGLTPETVRHFSIESDERRHSWTFPVGSARALKAKNFDSEATPKYHWVDGQPTDGANVYNLEACSGLTEAWIFEGEPDVWVAHQAGVAALSLTGGANKDGAITARMKAGVLEIVNSGLQTVNICYDSDVAGEMSAQSLSRLFAGYGVAAPIRALPAEQVGPKGDLTDLYVRNNCDDARLRVMLADLPVVPTNSPPAETVEAKENEPEWAAPLSLREVAVPEFPIGVLPTWMRNMVEQVSLIAQTPADLAVMFLLGVLSAIWSRRVTVQIRPHWSEPVNLYLVGAAESGSRKSAVYKLMVGPVSEYEKALQQECAHELSLKRIERNAVEERLKQVQALAAKSDTAEERSTHLEQAEALLLELEAIGELAAPRLLADSVTPEKLVSLLVEQGGRMAILEPEGSLFGMLSGRYSRRPDLSAFLKGHTGEDIRTDRIARGSEIVRSPALTLGLALQPSVLEDLTGNPELRGTGLLARFLYSIPRRHVGSRSNALFDADERLIAQYNVNVTRLLRSAESLDGDTILSVPLTAEGASVLREWSDWIEPRLAEFGELGGLADWASKLAGHTARIAALLHLCENPADPAPWKSSIGPESVRRAVEIGQYLVPHGKAAHAMMGQDPAIATADYVWRWIAMQEADDLSARDIFEGTKCARIRKMAQLRVALDLLVEHGYLRERPQPLRVGAGRKPSPRYDVNPLARSHNSRITRKAS